MASSSKIEWTDRTWNPVTGCDKVSPGCKHCYAERMAHRLKRMGQPKYADGFAVRCHAEALSIPAQWRRSRRVFVNSMSDLFHPAVPDDFIAEVYDVMAVRAPWHTYQVLTKRPERAAALNARLPWPEQVWLGVSVEHDAYRGRIDILRRIPAAVRFLSLEPPLGPLPGLDLSGVDWAIVGGESGPGARPMQADWARDVRDQCLSAGVPFFFKQWGGPSRSRAGRELDGRTWDELPHSAEPTPGYR